MKIIGIIGKRQSDVMEKIPRLANYGGDDPESSTLKNFRFLICQPDCRL